MAKKQAPKKSAGKAVRKPAGKVSSPKASKSEKLVKPSKALPAEKLEKSKSKKQVLGTVPKLSAKPSQQDQELKSALKKPAERASVEKKKTPQMMTAAGKADQEPAKPKKSSEKMTRVSAGRVESISKEEVHPQWYEFYRKHHQSPAQNYDMRSRFESQAPLLHKVLGWGWILSNDNDRLEVLFKDGKRMLISNYKAPA
jgi:hypothetical protein